MQTCKAKRLYWTLQYFRYKLIQNTPISDIGNINFTASHKLNIFHTNGKNEPHLVSLLETTANEQLTSAKMGEKRWSHLITDKSVCSIPTGLRLTNTMHFFKITSRKISELLRFDITFILILHFIERLRNVLFLLRVKFPQEELIYNFSKNQFFNLNYKFEK